MTRRRRPEPATTDAEGHVPEHEGPPDPYFGQHVGHDPGCVVCGVRRLASHRGLSVPDFEALALRMMNA